MVHIQPLHVEKKKKMQCVLGGVKGGTEREGLLRSTAFKLFPSFYVDPLTARLVSYCDGWGCCQQFSQKRS